MSNDKNKTKLRRREPKGEKGRRTKELIQQAIIDLVSIEGLGLDEIKLDGICKKAGVTIGAFYFHFENRDTAINETAIDSMNRVLDQIRGMPQEDDLYGELKQLIKIYIRALVETPKETRLVYAAIRNSPAVHKAYEGMHFEISDRLQSLVSKEREMAGCDLRDSQLIVEFLLAGIESFVENIYMWDNPRNSKLGDDPEKLAHSLAVMWVKMVTTRLTPNE